MSNLQQLVNNLIHVIVKYSTMQGISTIPTSITLVQQNQTQLDQQLAQLIVRATAQNSKRKTFLDYLANIIHDIKPLIDQEVPLTAEQETQLQQLLTALFETTLQLLQCYDTKTCTFQYAGQSHTAHGFMRAITWGFAYSKVGLLMQQLLQEQGFPLPADANSQQKIAQRLQTLIATHQAPLKEKQQESTAESTQPEDPPKRYSQQSGFRQDEQEYNAAENSSARSIKPSPSMLLLTPRYPGLAFFNSPSFQQSTAQPSSSTARNLSLD